MRTDLRDVITNAAESVETAFGARGVHLETAGLDSPVWVDADPRDLEQVLVNLMTNARDASPEGGVVGCGLSVGSGRAKVIVADRGPGLPDGNDGRLFQPFYTTKKSGGTGLGLAISREIVHRHGGEIGISPREGGGAEAWVELPLSGNGDS
jgi:signal transduction histidine kinase